jgi:hypothetical protein
MTREEKTSKPIVDMTQEECKSCNKDWTKCGSCSVMIKWMKEHRKEK